MSGDLIFAGILLTFATSVVGFVTTRRKVQEVHVLVNAQLSTVLRRVIQLTGALEDADVEVPEEPAG